jgi:glycine/D-amino acid oxidase-like deaminating enzyme
MLIDKKFPKLEKDTSTEVVVIGGGITGLLNAYKLAKSGRDVVLIEKKQIGSGATPLTTAFITKLIDSDLKEISEIFGEEKAQLVWRSGQEAISQFEKIINEEKIECHFTKCPNYLYASTKRQFDSIKEDFEYYKKFGIEASLEEDGKYLNFPNFGYLKIPNQAKFYIDKFIEGLTKIVTNLGVKIYEGTEAKDIKGEGPVTVITNSAKIEAKDVVIATYKPFTNKKTHLKKAMYRTYVFEVEIPKGLLDEALYEDGGNPYYYFRVDPEEKYDSLVIGGEDHKDIFGKSLIKKSYEGLEKYLSKIIKEKNYKIKSKWNGPILEPSDGLPLIGRIRDHLYVGTAFSGNGMTYSMISSEIIKDLILENTNPYVEIYNPTRTLLHPKRLGIKAKDYIEEFVSGALKNIFSK